MMPKWSTRSDPVTLIKRISLQDKHEQGNMFSYMSARPFLTGLILSTLPLRIRIKIYLCFFFVIENV